MRRRVRLVAWLRIQKVVQHSSERRFCSVCGRIRISLARSAAFWTFCVPANNQENIADAADLSQGEYVNREVPPDVIFRLYELTLRLWKNGANSAVKCIRRLRLWACTHVEYGWVASGPWVASMLQVSTGRRRCIRIRIRFVTMSVAEPKVNV